MFAGWLSVRMFNDPVEGKLAYVFWKLSCIERSIKTFGLQQSYISAFNDGYLEGLMYTALKRLEPGLLSWDGQQIDPLEEFKPSNHRSALERLDNVENIRYLISRHLLSVISDYENLSRTASVEDVDELEKPAEKIFGTNFVTLITCAADIMADILAGRRTTNLTAVERFLNEA